MEILSEQSPLEAVLWILGEVQEDGIQAKFPSLAKKSTSLALKAPLQVGPGQRPGARLDGKPMQTKHMKVDAFGQIHESTFEEARKALSIPLQV